MKKNSTEVTFNVKKLMFNISYVLMHEFNFSENEVRRFFDHFIFLNDNGLEKYLDKFPDKN